MKTNINIYLSSTDFHYDTDCYPDVTWKLNLKTSFQSRIYGKFEDFNISFHDPLEKISDKAEIVVEDIQHIISADFIVSYLPRTKLSIGTIMELQYSVINKSKDSVILIDRYNIHRNHPWIKYWVKHVVDNEDEAVEKILNILGKGGFNNLKER